MAEYTKSRSVGLWLQGIVLDRDGWLWSNAGGFSGFPRASMLARGAQGPGLQGDRVVAQTISKPPVSNYGWKTGAAVLFLVTDDGRCLAAILRCGDQGKVRVQEWENCITLTLPSPVKGEGNTVLYSRKRGRDKRPST